MNYVWDILRAAWHILGDSSLYVLFGLMAGGLVKAFLHPSAVARHLGRGRFKPVLKAALWGIPLPLCSCGVLPAALSLRKQGANNGATTAFLIATPESGVDSMAITYALLDPLLTVARPLAAFATALVAGIAENLLPGSRGRREAPPDLSCPVDGCCDGVDCDPAVHAAHHTRVQKVLAGLSFAFGELWGDLALWFLAGLILAGGISALLPEDFLVHNLGSGLLGMLVMLGVGIPMYICATASTPVAAALVLKGLSPGAALVFLLAGPATNLTSLTMLLGVMGKRATLVYLGGIAVCSVLAGLALDAIYAQLGFSAQAVAGQAAELFPAWLETAGAVALLLLSLPPVWRGIKNLARRLVGRARPQAEAHGCSCSACRPVKLELPRVDG